MTTKNAGALPLDNTDPRGIMKLQKGAVDLTVGPNAATNMLTARGTAGRSTSFYSSVSFRCYVHQDHKNHDEAQQKAKYTPLIHQPHLPSQGSSQPPYATAHTFARIDPVASFEVIVILPFALCFVKLFIGSAG